MSLQKIFGMSAKQAKALPWKGGQIKGVNKMPWIGKREMQKLQDQIAEIYRIATDLSDVRIREAGFMKAMHELTNKNIGLTDAEIDALGQTSSSVPSWSPGVFELEESLRDGGS